MQNFIGAGEGIRTLGLVRAPVFKTGAVVRLATPAPALLPAPLLKPYRILFILS